MVLKVTGDSESADVGEKHRLADHVAGKAPRSAPEQRRGATASPRAPARPAGRCSLSQAECREGDGELHLGGAGTPPVALQSAPPGRARRSAGQLRQPPHANRVGARRSGARGTPTRSFLPRALCFHFVKRLFLSNVGFICHSHLRDENPAARPVTRS